MRYVRRLWHGELPLQIVFWNWAVLGGLIVNFASSAAFLYLLVAEQVVAALIVGYVLSVPYNLVVMVGVWRSANRYDGDRRLAGAAKLVTLAGLFVLSFL